MALNAFHKTMILSSSSIQNWCRNWSQNGILFGTFLFSRFFARGTVLSHLKTTSSANFGKNGPPFWNPFWLKMAKNRGTLTNPVGSGCEAASVWRSWGTPGSPRPPFRFLFASRWPCFWLLCMVFGRAGWLDVLCIPDGWPGGVPRVAHRIYNNM